MWREGWENTRSRVETHVHTSDFASGQGDCERGAIPTRRDGIKGISERAIVLDNERLERALSVLVRGAGGM